MNTEKAEQTPVVDHAVSVSVEWLADLKGDVEGPKVAVGDLIRRVDRMEEKLVGKWEFRIYTAVVIAILMLLKFVK